MKQQKLEIQFVTFQFLRPVQSKPSFQPSQ